LTPEEKKNNKTNEDQRFWSSKRLSHGYQSNGFKAFHDPSKLMLEGLKTQKQKWQNILLYQSVIITFECSDAVFSASPLFSPKNVV
jgi:hypothetical protein